VVLEVGDALLPVNAGRWRLRGGPDGAEVARVDHAPDLALDVRELGSAYLGGVTLGALAGAGLVREHTPGAVARASTAFGWPVAPVCGWVF
jgi:predicted acetyltransferase